MVQGLPHRIEFQSTLGYRLLAAVFFVVGVLVLFFFATEHWVPAVAGGVLLAWTFRAIMFERVELPLSVYARTRAAA